MADLHKSLQSLKVKVNQILPGYLGISDSLVSVPGRPGYSYVRLLGNTNELIQAYNTAVTPQYNIPVLVQWDGTKYTVLGRDVKSYSQWSNSAYMALHGDTHQWKGGDTIWIQQEQFYPLMVSPSGSSLLIAPYAYNWQGSWVFGGNSDTTTITLPSDPAKQSVLLLYLDGPTGNPTWLPGTEAPLYTDKNSLLPYLPNFNSSLGIPLAMVRIPSGTTSWTWDNLYDVRQLFGGFTTTSGSSTTGSSGGNVYGPVSNNDSYIPQWNGANSKTLKNGVQLVTSVGVPGSDSSVPSEKAVRTALSAITGSSGGISEAPIDGNIYGRKNAGWSIVSGSSTTGSSGIGEAPINGLPYSRENAGWVVSPTGSNYSLAPTIIIGNGNNQVVATGATAYISAGYFGLSAARTDVYLVSPAAGVLRNFRVRTNSAQSAGGTLVLTVRVNNTDTNIVISIPAGSAASGTWADVTHTAGVAAGQSVEIKILNNGTGNSAQIGAVSLEFDTSLA